MRVLVNAVAIDTAIGGTWTYLEGVLRGWAREHPRDRLLAIVHPSFPAGLEGELEGFATVRRASTARVARLLEQQLLTGVRARRFRAHAVFNAALSAPVLRVGLPEVSMAHDVRHVVRPQEFAIVPRLYRRLVYNRTIRRSMLLTCGGAATREAMHDRLRIDPSHIRVIPLGADHVDAWRRAAKGRHGLAFAHWANKRPETAIRAWGVLRSWAEGEAGGAAGFDRLLHIAGAPAEDAPGLSSLAAAEGVGDLVCIHGRLPDGEFQELISGAAVLLLPSTLEGFGIPVVEAMRLGVPVVASAGVGIEQAGGDAALYADADDPAAFAAHCRRLFADGAYTAEVVRRGEERAATCTWAETARLTRAAVRDAVLLWRARRQG